MSDTKRSKGSSSRRAAGATSAAAVSVLEAERDLAPVHDEFGDIDDILGELAEPARDAPPTDLDDILGEIAAPAPAAAVDGLDDILNEVAGPAPADAGLGLDDILNEVAGPAADSFDDILSEIAGPAKAEPAESLDDILSEVAGPVKAAPVEADAVSDDLTEMLDGLAADAAAAAPDAAVEKKPGIVARLMRLPGALVPRLDGTRTISRKAHAGLVGAVGLLGLAAAGEAAYIVLRPPPAPVPAVGHTTVLTVVPVDYSKVDLARYRDKKRSLAEGGRDMLRNPAIKQAIVDLNNGEKLYEDIRSLAQASPVADLVTIGDDKVVIASCNAPVCGDKSFRLVYDLHAESATVCMTERYFNGSYLSYSYSPAGYREEPSCQAAG